MNTNVADFADIMTGVQFGGDEVVKAKDGAGSATLSMAYAGFRFAEKLIKAAKGESGIVEPTYVYLPGVDGGKEIAEATGCEYFSVPVELGVSSHANALKRKPLTRDSPLVPSKLTTSSVLPTTTRRSCSKLATLVSRATSPRVSSLSRTPLPSKSFFVSFVISSAY